MGTRFMATKEAPIHDSIKQELVKGTERDTALIMRTFRNTARIFKVFSQSFSSY
jgi:NADH:quinone reductase (non-electrogenic)